MRAGPAIGVSLVVATLAAGTQPVTASRFRPGAANASGAAPRYTTLSGVSCFSAGDCVAVGYTGPGISQTAGERPLVEIRSGGRWRIVPTPTPPHHRWAELTGVSCPSATSCIAVGFSFPREGRETAFAERWNGGSWILLPGAQVRQARLDGVSCTSPTSCTAVGSYATARALVERWNGRTWNVQRTSPPRTRIYTHTYLNAVSCTSPNACVAVGESDTDFKQASRKYDRRSLIERWNGRRWSVEPTQRPPRTSQAYLKGVSCVAARFCEAVGLTSYFGEINYGLLAERWRGTEWKIQPLSDPPMFSPLQFAGVSCTSVSQCMAVGNPPPASSVFAAQQSGSGWTMLPTPAPPGEFDVSLAAVSCTSPTACTAVGEADNGARSIGQTLVERWNGSSWEIEPSPTP